MEDSGCDWHDDSLHSIDLEYHNIDASKSLYGALVDSGEMRTEVDDLAVLDAMTDPPQNTRALGRSKLVAKAIKRGRLEPYIIDWSGVVFGRKEYIEMPDPFKTYEEASD